MCLSSVCTQSMRGRICCSSSLPHLRPHFHRGIAPIRTFLHPWASVGGQPYPRGSVHSYLGRVFRPYQAPARRTLSLATLTVQARYDRQSSALTRDTIIVASSAGLPHGRRGQLHRSGGGHCSCLSGRYRCATLALQAVEGRSSQPGRRQRDARHVEGRRGHRRAAACRSRNGPAGGAAECSDRVSGTVNRLHCRLK